MKLLNAMVSSLLLLVTTSTVACAPAESDDAEEAGQSSEDALRTLQAAEIAGSIQANGSTLMVEAPRTEGRIQYRALSFTARAGDDFVAEVMATNASDSIAYILDSEFRTLRRNDDSGPGVKDSRVTFRATKAGTYYLAFRNKQGFRTSYAVKLTRTGGVPVSFREGWADAQRGYDVRIESPNGFTTINSYTQACPTEAPSTGTYAFAGQFTCQIDLAANQISCRGSRQIVGGSGSIMPDGSFVIGDSDGWGRNSEHTLVKGQLHPEGKVTVTEARFSHCGPNSNDQLVLDAAGLRDGAGVAQPRR